MKEVLVGATLPQFTDDRDRFLNAARVAEDSGVDSVWVFDHMWPLSGGKERPMLEAWTSLGFLAGSTERIRIGTLVTRSSLRHPALLAKMIATVAAIAPGRLIVAIGSGDDLSKDEHQAFGFEYFDADKRVEQLRSCVQVVRDYLSQERVTQHDDFVDVEDLTPSPPGGIVPLWLGGRSDDVIETAAQVADGWNGWGGTPKRLARDVRQLVTYAAGREVEPSWAGDAVLAPDDDQADAFLGKLSSKPSISGGPERVAKQLTGFVEAGARHLILTPARRAEPAFYELLGAEVKPRLPEALGAGD